MGNKRTYTFLITTLVVFASGCTGQKSRSSNTSAGDSEAQHTQATSGFSKLSGFSVKVSFSDRAKKTLVENKETVVVAGYATGFPKPGAPKQYVSDMGEIALGQVQAEVPPKDIVSFNDIQLRRDALEQIDSHGPQLLINVYSGRKSSKDNLLDCTIYEGALKDVQGRSIPISCKLIGE